MQGKKIKGTQYVSNKLPSKTEEANLPKLKLEASQTFFVKGAEFIKKDPRF